MQEQSAVVEQQSAQQSEVPAPYVPVNVNDANALSEASLVAAINAEEEQVVLGLRHSVGHAIREGHLLIEAKKRLKHGEWTPWVKANVRASKKTAEVYMRIARKTQHARDLEVDSIRALLRAFGQRPTKEARHRRPIRCRVLRRICCPHCGEWARVSSPDACCR